jgi:DNA-binding response OmpR family regulator
MSHPKVLVADDSVTIQKVFELAFESEKIELLIAGDCATAYAVAKESRPRLVIADVNMPDGDGFSLCRRIKTDPALAGTPVFLLTSALDDFDQEAARKAGADGKFEKPFRSEEMVSKVHEMIKSVDAVAVPAPDDEWDQAEAAAAAAGEDGGDDFEDFDDFDIPLESLMENVDLGDESDESVIIEDAEYDEDDETTEGDEDDSIVIVDEEDGETVDAEGWDITGDVPPPHAGMLDLSRQAAVEDDIDDDDLSVEVVSDDAPEEIADEPVRGGGASMEDDGELSEEARRILANIDAADREIAEAASSLGVDHPEERVRESVERAVGRGEGMSPDAMKAAVELAVSRAVEGMITQGIIEKAVRESVDRLLADMREEMLDIFKKIAADVTLNVAEDLVRQTIEQIKSEVEPG